MRKIKAWRPRRLAATALVDQADVRAALAEAIGNNIIEAGDDVIRTAAAMLDGAAWALLKRLASARTTDLDQIEKDLQTIAQRADRILEAIEPDLTGLDDVGDVQRVTGADAKLASILRVKSAKAPPTSLVLALEGGALAAGFKVPDQALDVALTHLANLASWARTATDSFSTGRGAPRKADLNKLKLRQRDNLDVPSEGAALGVTAAIRLSKPLPPTHAHAGVDFGFAVIGAYAAVSGRRIAVSRTSSTRTSSGGNVTGPLTRFTLAIYACVRFRLDADPSFRGFSELPAFNPTGATVANWVAILRRRPK